MAVRILSSLEVGSGYPQIINTAADDAISLIPGLIDQWYVSETLTTGFDAVATSVWVGLTNGTRLVGRAGVNARPMDYISAISAANDQDGLRSGWDTDADPDDWDGNNERTQLISEDNLFDGTSSWAVFVAVICPVDAAPASPSNRQIWGSDEGTETPSLRYLTSSGNLQFYQDVSDTNAILDSSADYQDDAVHVIGVGYDATDNVITMRVDGVQKGTLSASGDADLENIPLSKLVIGGSDDALSAAFTGYYFAVVMVRGSSLMRGKALSGYSGDEDDALAAVEQGLMERFGLVYPG